MSTEYGYSCDLHKITERVGMAHTEWLLGDLLWDLCSTTRAEDSGGWWFFVIYQWQNTGGSTGKSAQT